MSRTQPLSIDLRYSKVIAYLVESIAIIHFYIYGAFRPDIIVTILISASIITIT